MITVSDSRWRQAAVVLVAVVASGCSSSSARHAVAPPRPSISVSPSPSADPNGLARSGALSAYRGFRQAQVAAEAIANPRYAGLAKYAGDKALAQERGNLLQLASAGIVVRGAPVLNPVVGTASAQAVTIMDCVNTARWQPVYKATGKSAAAPGQPSTVLATALARPYGKGWLIVELTTERSRPC